MGLVSKGIGLGLFLLAVWPLINGFLEIELLMAGELIYQLIVGILGLVLLTIK